MSTAIEFDNIGKQYRLGLVSTQTISNDLKRWWYMNILHKEDPFLKIGETNDRSIKGRSEYVWALKDINFKVEQGDVVGIIAKNGAGKSTLLKLLSRVTSPTTGEIRARGRIGSLLEVGTGFHPEMTGMENIFLNGAILGMSKREIKSKLDEIIDFSGCERYIDTPVKRYSSGMMVRLGFAVAAHLDPEILVVDEVLAVGDAEFQKKAIGKMKDVSQGEGRTVLFVSHNMASIKNLCKSCVMLKNGTIHKIGETEEVVDEYLSENLSKSVFVFQNIDKTLPNKFVSFKIFNSRNIESHELFTGESFRIEIGVQNLLYDQSIGVGVYFNNNFGERIAGFTSFSGNVSSNLSSDSPVEKFLVEIPNMMLTTGTYNISITLVKKNVEVYDSIANIGYLSVNDSLPNVGNYLGYFYFESKWTVI